MNRILASSTAANDMLATGSRSSRPLVQTPGTVQHEAFHIVRSPSNFQAAPDRMDYSDRPSNDAASPVVLSIAFISSYVKAPCQTHDLEYSSSSIASASSADRSDSLLPCRIKYQ